MKASQSLLDELANFDTPTVINAVDALGIVGAYEHYMSGDIGCLTPSLPPMVGCALTIKLDASSPGGGDEADFLELLEALEAESVRCVVAVETDGPERMKECVLGDGMAKTMAALGACGLVTNGGARDIGGIERVGFGVFGFGLVAHHSSLLWHDFGGGVNIGGMCIEPGDLLHGDANGCIRVPPECYPCIVEACQEVSSFEIAVHLALRNTGLSVARKMEARASHVADHRRRMAELRRKHAL